MTIDQRLKYAREKAGLTLAAVHETTGIGVSSLSDFENGKRDPSVHQLSLLGRAYRRSIDFFTDEGEIPAEVVLWRNKPQSPKAEEIEAQFLQLCEQYYKLEQWCGEPVPCKLPPVKFCLDAASAPALVASLAVDVRRRLGLGDRPAVGLLHALEEDCGVKVFHMPWEPSGSAACARSPAFGSAILLNDRNTRWRRNFDLAHELFHLLTWDVFRPGGAGATPLIHEQQEESLASQFARHLLMPDDVVRLEVGDALRDGKLRLGEVADIARRFDVSVEALLWRIHELYGRDRTETKGDIEQYQAKAGPWQDQPIEPGPKVPARYEALAKKALHRGEMSVGRYAEFMGVSRREAERVGSMTAEQGAYEDEEVTLAPA